MRKFMVTLKTCLVGICKGTVKTVQALIGQIRTVRLLGWKETWETRHRQIIWESILLFLFGNFVIGCGLSNFLPNNGFWICFAQVCLFIYGLVFGIIGVALIIIKDEIDNVSDEPEESTAVEE